MTRLLRAASSILCVAVIALTGCSGGRFVPSSTASNQTRPVDAFNRTYARTGVTLLASQPPVAMQLAFLMTDGSVMAQSYSNNTWYKYVPDQNGNYSNGTWTQVASLPSGYGPSAFSSAVMADGRLLISGGEYNNGGHFTLQLTNKGAIYDPLKNTWTPIGHPTGWYWIGDSPSNVLPNGLFFLGEKLNMQGAVFDEKTMSWQVVGTAGKSDFNAEEGYTLLPNGKLLTEDVKNAPNSEIYDPAAGTWTSAGSTIVDLHSPTPYTNCLQYGPKKRDCYWPPGEIGPAMLRPDGTVFATGSYSNGGSGPGHTAIYTVSTGKWRVGPDFPNGDNAGDSWAVLLPSGNVLVFGVSGTLYEFDGTQFHQTGFASGTPLLLPTGQVLMVSNTVQLYTPSGNPQSSWLPTISSVPTTLTRGSSYMVSGTQFNGLSKAVEFGDEYQPPTNYPLVRITNAKTGHVYYARTHDHSSMGVQTGNTPVSTHFDVPSTMETGASTLVVVANGIASKPVTVTVK